MPSGLSGTTSAIGTYTPAATDWLALKTQNASATYAGQRCYVKATYTAPAAVGIRSAGAPLNTVAIWTGSNASADPGDCRNWENGVLPSATTDALVPTGSTFTPSLATGVLATRDLIIEPGATVAVAADTSLRIAGNLTNQGTFAGTGQVLFNSPTTQTITGATAFANLWLSNPADVTLLGPLAVSDILTLQAGRLIVDDQALALGATATIAGVDVTLQWNGNIENSDFQRNDTAV